MSTSVRRHSGLPCLLLLATLLALVVGLGTAAAHPVAPPQIVDPPVVTATLAPGGTLIVDKIVHPVPDFVGAVTATTTLPPFTFCDPDLIVSVTPPGQPLASPNDAVFVETITVAPTATPGSTLTCVVAFVVIGVTPGGPFAEIRGQRIFIQVLDNPPVAACEETVNPHGQTVPPAGSTTLPGPKGGINEDGFYKVAAVDPEDPNPQVFVVDAGSGTVFGPFASGTRIKYTEAPGATPTIKAMGSDNGNAGNAGHAGAVDFHITGTGDAAVFAVDASGNESPLVSCPVPPPPK